MTLTQQEQLACDAQQLVVASQHILRCLCKKGPITQQQLMAILIAYIAQASNMSISCAELEANAAEYSCLPPQLMLPALIWLIQNGGVISSPQVVWFSSNGVGTPPPFTPVVGDTQYQGVNTSVIATDTSTGQQWNFNPNSGQWQ